MKVTEPSAAVVEAGATEPTAVKDEGATEPTAVKDVGATEPTAVKDEGATEPAAVKDEGATEPAAVKDEGATEPAAVKDEGATEPTAVKEWVTESGRKRGAEQEVQPGSSPSKSPRGEQLTELRPVLTIPDLAPPPVGGIVQCAGESLRPCSVQLVNVLLIFSSGGRGLAGRGKKGVALPKDLRPHQRLHTGKRPCCFTACGNGVWRLQSRPPRLRLQALRQEVQAAESAEETPALPHGGRDRTAAPTAPRPSPCARTCAGTSASTRGRDPTAAPSAARSSASGTA